MTLERALRCRTAIRRVSQMGVSAVSHKYLRGSFSPAAPWSRGGAFSKIAPIAASKNTAPRFYRGADDCWRQFLGTVYERSSEVPHKSETEETYQKPGQGGLPGSHDRSARERVINVTISHLQDPPAPPHHGPGLGRRRPGHGRGLTLTGTASAAPGAATGKAPSCSNATLNGTYTFGYISWQISQGKSAPGPLNATTPAHCHPGQARNVYPKSQSDGYFACPASAGSAERDRRGRVRPGMPQPATAGARRPVVRRGDKQRDHGPRRRPGAVLGDGPHSRDRVVTAHDAHRLVSRIG